MSETQPLLRVEDLHTGFGVEEHMVRAVDGVTFTVNRGEAYALLGESGCGKSMTALSILKLVPMPAGRITGGRVWLGDEDLLRYPEVAMRRVRGRRAAMIFQEPMTSLNPVVTVGGQIAETVMHHSRLSSAALRARVQESLSAVGIPDPERRAREYPHQLSGGMKQRVMIAMALAARPDLLIADEPTTALDVTTQAQVLELISALRDDTGMALLLITHDLGVVREMADRIGVMYAGHIIEEAPAAAFFSAPRHPYTQALFESLPSARHRTAPLATIKGNVPRLDRVFPGCRFASRCTHAWELCETHAPRWVETGAGHAVRCHLADPAVTRPSPVMPEPPVSAARPGSTSKEADRQVLDVRDLAVHFPVRRGVFKRIVGHVRAVDGVSFSVRRGQTLALVGESGCGKTTAGKGLLQLIAPTRGSVMYAGSELTRLRGEALRRRRAELQIIFQDPFSSMNPRMLVADIIEEGMLAQAVGASAAQRRRLIDTLLEDVGLPADAGRRYPHEFSGGQRQRICIARALAVRPSLIVCDEPTSALDVSVQAQILNLLKRLQSEHGLAYLFITHNIAVVAYLADTVAVMYLGRLVEEGPVEAVLESPRHPYTQALLSAVPAIDSPGEQRIRLGGEPPSPANPPGGCHFHPRCAHAMPVCRERYPPVVSFNGAHTARCFLYE